MDASNPDRDDFSVAKGYALTGKIMLSAIVILFFVVITMVCLHLYARWYLLTSRRRQLRRRTRRPHLVFVVDPPNNPAVPSRGLDAGVLKTLPVFVYGSGMDPIECAVCLSEFEENESGRTLTKCNHSFHIECIDMWFQSHATCPLCRSTVEPVVPQNQAESSSSGLCATCQHDGDASPSLVNGGRKPPELIGIAIQVPRRNGGFDDNTATGSPSSYRSPMSRMLSLTRMLSRERRGNAPSPSYVESPNELDVEKGRVGTSGSQSKIGGDSVQ